MMFLASALWQKKSLLDNAEKWSAFIRLDKDIVHMN